MGGGKPLRIRGIEEDFDPTVAKVRVEWEASQAFSERRLAVPTDATATVARI